MTYQGNRVIQQMELAAAGEVQSAFPLINVTKPSILTGVQKANLYSHDFLTVRILGESNFHTANTNLPRFANLNRPFVPYAEDLRATGTFGRADDGMLPHVWRMEGKTIPPASFTQDVPVVFMQVGKGGEKGNIAGVGSMSSDVTAVSGANGFSVPARLESKISKRINLLTFKTPDASVSSISIHQEGGLNLFKWGENQTTVNNGWREGDCMLSLPDLGNPKANWEQNASWLREKMRQKKPIYDSYRDPLTGIQIETKGFLNAERNLLKSHGWVYNPQTGAYHPPISE